LEWLCQHMAKGPCMFLSVHPLLNHILAEGLAEIFGSRKPTLPLITVITDLGAAHFSWFEPRCDAIYVATEALRLKALDLRVDAARVHVTGLPVREGFWEPDTLSKMEVQSKLGLSPSTEPDVVLLMGGGEGFGNLYEVAVKIGVSLAAHGRGQLVVVCGRNEALKAQLDLVDFQELAASTEAWSPLVLGFVSNVDEYMSAADLLVTKAGPGSIAEAMIKGLPCVLTNFIPGQEEGNITFVTENKTGTYVSDETPEEVAETVNAWLWDPDLLRKMSANALALGQPRATLEIAHSLHELFLTAGSK